MEGAAISVSTICQLGLYTLACIFLILEGLSCIVLYSTIPQSNQTLELLLIPLVLDSDRTIA